MVYEVLSKIDGKIYAAKKFNFPIESKENMWIDMRMQIQVEVDIMRAHEHVLVIKLEDIVKDQNNHPYIIMEKFDSSLNDLIKNQVLQENDIRRIFAMICISLFFIHKNGIIHRDMKPHNVLIKTIGG